VQKQKIITVIGNIASGKSTLAERLAQSLDAEYVAADDLYLTNPFFQAAVLDRTRWSLASDLWFLKKRVELLNLVDKSERSIVVDSGLLMGLAYAKMREPAGFYTPAEWNLYLDYYHTLLTSTLDSDLVIYLSIDPKLILERIRIRGREHEIKHYTQEYIVGLQGGIDFVVEDLWGNGVQVIQKNITSIQAVEDKVYYEVVEEMRRYDFGK
jgi:deoxyadenosine/deoxycytidine kinase